jgi:predicted nucleotidyltransferase
MNIGLSDDVIQKIRSVLAKHKSVQSAILFGSRAKGNFKTGSDIDLTLKGSLNLSELATINHEIDELSLPFTFDFSIHDMIDNRALSEHIARVGIEFYSAAS